MPGSITRTDAGSELLRRIARRTGRSIEELNRPAGTGCTVLVLDCSGSMSGIKLNQATSGGEGYADMALHAGYDVGVIAFNSSAWESTEPTRDMDLINRSMQLLEADESTNMAAGIELAFRRLRDRGGHRVLCLVTDGAPDDANAAIRIADEVKKAGIHIHAIGTDDANMVLLRKLASPGELVLETPANLLGKAIASAAKALPGPRKLLE